MNFIKSMQSFWSQLFSRHLLFTNIVSSGILLAAGDGIQQTIELKRKVHATGTYDWKRTTKLFIVGLFLGPPHHYFYIWLDKVFPHKNPKSVMKKIIIDQIVAAPFFGIGFFGCCGLLEKKPLSEVKEECIQKFPAVYLFDWALWPPAQTINFYYVPTRYRVLYINGVTVLWDVFLSFMKHYDQAPLQTSKIQSLGLKNNNF